MSIFSKDAQKTRENISTPNCGNCKWLIEPDEIFPRCRAQGDKRISLGGFNSDKCYKLYEKKQELISPDYLIEAIKSFCYGFELDFSIQDLTSEDYKKYYAKFKEYLNVIGVKTDPINKNKP